MSAPVDPSSFKEALLVLGAAGVLVPLMHRIGISPVLGFLGIGMLVGPFGLGQLVGAYPWLGAITIGESEEMALIGEAGVIFLLFFIGLELSYQRLVALRRLVFGLGFAQVLVSSIVIAALVHLMGLDAVPAAIVGTALALSSTAIVMEVLSGNRRLTTQSGRVSFAVLLFQDLAVVPLLFAIGVLGSRSDAPLGPSLLIAGTQTIAVMASILLIGRFVLRPLFRLVSATRSSELFMATTFLVAIGAAVATASVGLSMALGAFVAGILLAETEYRRAIQVTIEPFKGLLLGFFFISVGMAIDLDVVAGRPLAVVGAAAGLIAIKIVLTAGVARAFGMPRQVIAESALLLAPGGEFAFVAMGLAVGAGLVGAGQSSFILAAVSLTMLTIPALGWGGRNLAEWLRRDEDETTAREIVIPHVTGPGVIVVGFGRVGQLVAEMLASHDVRYVASDLDPYLVDEQRKAGRNVYFGDGSRGDFLHALGLSEATALIVTMRSSDADEVIAFARAERPDLMIVARARDAEHGAELYRRGASVAVPETIEASLQLSEAALVGAGVPMGKAIAAIHGKRDAFRKLLQARYASAPSGEADRR